MTLLTAEIQIPRCARDFVLRLRSGQALPTVTAEAGDLPGAHARKTAQGDPSLRSGFRQQAVRAESPDLPIRSRLLNASIFSTTTYCGFCYSQPQLLGDFSIALPYR